MAEKIKKPTDAEYRKAEIVQAINFAPEIYACKKCGWPVACGYCCTYCSDTDPSSED